MEKGDHGQDYANGEEWKLSLPYGWRVVHCAHDVYEMDVTSCIKCRNMPIEFSSIIAIRVWGYHMEVDHSMQSALNTIQCSS